MRRRSTSLFALAAAAALSCVSACGSGSSGGGTPADPKAELTSSVSNLSSTDVLTTTLKLEATGADLRSLASADGDKLSAADADAIASAQLVVEAKTDDGSDLSDKSGHKTNVSLRVVSGGHTYLELRVISGDLFINADVKGFLGLIHKQQTYTEVKARASSLPAFVQAAVEGRWVTLNGAAAQGLAGQLGVTSQPSSSARSQKLIDDLKGILSTDVAVKRAGSDSRGDHLVLSGNTRKLATDFYTAANASVPGASTALARANPSEVPSRNVTVDAWVKDGALSEISLDVAQFARPGEAQGQHLRVALTFDRSGDDISKPSGATPVDLSQLSTLVGALG
jgi:hypothetical protein